MTDNDASRPSTAARRRRPPPSPSASRCRRRAAPSARAALTKRYGALTALDTLDLELESGDVFGFIGPNGAGKSTTMKILAGLLEPTQRPARGAGQGRRDNGDFVRRNVGYMPDFFGVYEDLKVTRVPRVLRRRLRHRPREQRKKIVSDVLELTDLKYKQDALVDSLSRGMKQRLEPRPRAGPRPADAAARRARQRPRPAGAHRDPRAAQGAPAAGQDDPGLQPHPLGAGRVL